MSDDEYEHVADDFAALENINWDSVLGERSLHPNHDAVVPSINVTRRSPSAASRATESSHFFDSEEALSEGLLAELDILEAGITQSLDTSAQNRATQAQDKGMTPARDARKRKRTASICSDLDEERDSTRTNTLLKLLTSTEDTLTCPICCDFCVVPQVGNPCGHSFCAECAKAWSKKNKLNQCAVCRGLFTKRRPLIPNLALGSVIEKHIETLGLLGIKEWKPGGCKYKEWHDRNLRARR